MLKNCLNCMNYSQKECNFGIETDIESEKYKCNGYELDTEQFYENYIENKNYSEIICPNCGFVNLMAKMGLCGYIDNDADVTYDCIVCNAQYRLKQIVMYRTKMKNKEGQI